jgi:cytochrome P450 family 9
MYYILHHGLSTGSPVDVTERMNRYTTDVIASCSFGITVNSQNDPKAEFSIFLRKVTEFSVRKGLAALMAFCAPKLKTLLKLKFMDDDTTNYLRKTVWSTVEYR